MKKSLLTAIIFLSTFFCCQAQFINLGQDPAYLKWKQIKTENFQIIYPDFFEENAQRAANIFNNLYNHANSLDLKPKKISVILHASGGQSNGNVGLAPRKMELYTAPPQDADDNWIEHLCIHEFRHVVQFDKINQGLTRVLYHIFGEILPIAVVGVYLPMWFIEGDAVYFETAVGNIGRGRSPEFLNQMKAQIIDKGIYHVSKATLGSYKDFVPNRYTLGYYMTSQTRINYGKDIWGKAVDFTGKHPFAVNPMSRSLRRSMAGKREELWNSTRFNSLFINPDSVRMANEHKDPKRTLYRDNFSELREAWKQELANTSNLFDTIPTSNKYYTNYYYPTADTSGTIYAYKEGLRETGAIVRIDGNSEKTITPTGILYDQKFGINNNHIVWSEYHPHVRWTLGGRMGLSSYDINRKKYKRHRNANNRYSPFRVEENWGVVEVDNRNQAYIVILDSLLNKEIWRIPAGKNELFLHPSYAEGKIATVIQTTNGLHLEIIDTLDKIRHIVSEKYHYQLDNPVIIDSTLIYRASFNSNNSLYQQGISDDNNNSHILDSRYGIRFPSYHIENDSLYFSFYTADGYKPGKVKLSELKHNPVEMKQFDIAQKIKSQENRNVNTNNDSTFSTRKYNKISHLFNIHSWGPVSVDIYDMDIDFGALIYSQNKLSTLSFTAGYILKSGYTHGAWLLNASYRGWWPIIDIEFETGKYEDFIGFAHNDIGFYVNNNARLSSGEVTLRLPFNLTRKNYNRSLQPYFRYKIEGVHNHSNVDLYDINGNYVEKHTNKPDSRYWQILEYGAIYSNQTRMTEREINPRWGQRFSAGYAHTPWEKIDLGYEWWIDGQFFLPGLFKYHSLSVYGGFQDMPQKKALYGKKIMNPRGINLQGHEIASLRTAYHIPICTPDLPISKIIFIKSLDGTLFFDMGKERYLSIPSNTYSSYGVELTSDVNFFRLTYPIDLGFRTGYETKRKVCFSI